MPSTMGAIQTNIGTSMTQRQQGQIRDPESFQSEKQENGRRTKLCFLYVLSLSFVSKQWAIGNN